MATNGVVNGTINGDGGFKLREEPAFTATRKMRVVCVGAGFSGLMVAHKIQHELKLEDEVDLTIYDRNPDIGGTWYENKYPGAGCDIPAHTYVFPFEGNPDWSSFYAGSDEILAYIKKTADKYNLRKNIQLETSIVEAIWNEESATWKIKIEQNGEIKDVEADFLINGGGFLNKWKWPDVKGLHDYKGKLVHSANWDPNYDWTGKKVAVIGNGSSGLQIVPAMQPKVEKLVNFVRQKTWISVNFLGEKTPEGKNFQYSEEQKKEWRENPKALYDYRADLEQNVNAFFFVMCLDHPAQPFFEGLCKDRMHASLKDAPELEERIMPDFRPGCRRISPGDGYLEALQQPNCTDNWDTIECFTEKGIKTTAGEEEFDMIVCASGFNSSWIPQFKVVGRDGATFEEQWKENPYAFFATQVENFPNYGIVNGPNPPISHGSVLSEMTWIVDYLCKWIVKMNRQNIRTIEVKKEAVEDFNEYSQAFLQRTVWSGDCKTLYKNGRHTGRITGVYGGSMTHFKEGLDNIGGEHFKVDWRSKNRFLCLGNGTTVDDAQGAGKLAPYFTEKFAGLEL